MEEIVFIKGEVRFVFNSANSAKPKDFGQLLQWPVPRVGEFVAVRRFGLPNSMEGYVERVEYYYSSGNMGPVVSVYLG